MADKYYNVAVMAQSAAERITENAKAWTDYLETAARLYRYGFKDQLLIHAQRPDATAVASIEVWNTRMHCWVNQGAKGIALLDETRKKKLRYVFDVSDVHKAKRIGIFPTLWEMKDQHHEAVMKRLEDIYGKTDEKRPIESRMIQIAEHIAEDYTPDVLQDLVNVQDDSLLYGLDEYNLSLRLKETMTSSIAYTLMARCGLDTDTYRDELDFSYIREFSTLDSLSVLGEATSSMCEPVLREICQVVEDIDRENARRVERESSEKDKNILANDGQEHYNTLKRESDTQNRKEGGTDYGRHRAWSSHQEIWRVKWQRNRKQKKSVSRKKQRKDDRRNTRRASLLTSPCRKAMKAKSIICMLTSSTQAGISSGTSRLQSFRIRNRQKSSARAEALPVMM